MIEVTHQMVHAFIRGYADADDGSSKVILENTAERAGIAAVLALYLRQVEGSRGAGLCDCDDVDSPPTSPRDGTPMDHHCDCRAVITAAVLLGAYSATQHAKQCQHGSETDGFYRRRSPAAS